MNVKDPKWQSVVEKFENRTAEEKAAEDKAAAEKYWQDRTAGMTIEDMTNMYLRHLEA